jgi:TIR domain
LKETYIPQCFISYSWDSPDHKDWVRSLADRLQKNGVSTSFDQWDVQVGMDVPNYVETRIRESDFVLLVCTPAFAKKADSNKGGVGYEKNVITGEVFAGIPPEKFLPLLRSGNLRNSLPSYLKAKAYIDFRDDSKFNQSLEELLRRVFSSPKYIRPELGKPPLLAPVQAVFQIADDQIRSTKISKLRKISGTAKTSRPRRASFNTEEMYKWNVFLNFPFTQTSNPLFLAVVFTVHALGFRPRSVLEIAKSGSSRFPKIFTLISECKFGIHDLSLTSKLNVAYKLGAFMGAQRFESSRNRPRFCLILDSHPYRYQKYLSDIAGGDVASHNNRPSVAVRIVRDWLRSTTGAKDMPSGQALFSFYGRFKKQLPAICKASKLSEDALTFLDYSYIVSKWLTTWKETQS